MASGPHEPPGLGWTIDRLDAGPLVTGMVTGTLGGVLGLRPQKVLLGPVVGVAAGVPGELRADHASRLFGLQFLTLHYRLHRKP